MKRKGSDIWWKRADCLAKWGREFRCVIVGDGPERDALARQILESGLGDRVVLESGRPQEQLIELMRQATVMVLPCIISETGDRDGLPTVLLEAQAMGLPTISTKVAGVGEIVDHDKSGLLVSPKDPSALAEAIDRILSDPGFASRMGREGRRKAEKEFDIRRNVSDLRNLFMQSQELNEALGGQS